MAETDQPTSRRAFLAATGAATLATLGANASARGSMRSVGGTAEGLGAIADDEIHKYDFILCRVKFAAEQSARDYWHCRPGADANLLQEFTRVVPSRVKLIEGARGWQPEVASVGQLNAVVTFDEPDRMARFPFLFMTSESHYDLTSSQRANLKEYILRGGFILMDDCMAQHRTDDFFYRSSVRILEEIFGRRSIRKVPNDHPVFHTVYDLGQIGLPHCNGVERGAYGLFVDDRLAVLLSSHDIHCGWCDRSGATFSGGHHGKHGFKEAIRMGINTIVYALSH